MRHTTLTVMKALILQTQHRVHLHRTTHRIHALAPGVYQPGKNFLLDILADITPVTLPWVSLYWVFTVLLLIMLLIVSLIHFPRIELKDDERSGSSASYKKLFRQRYVWLFFLGIFCYVSTEQGVSIFMSTFLEQYHGIDPKTVGAQSISYFWGDMSVLDGVRIPVERSAALMKWHMLGEVLVPGVLNAGDIAKNKRLPAGGCPCG